MQTTFKLFFSCLFCLSLTLLSGCGGGGGVFAPTLSPAEQAEVDKYITNYGTRSLAEYMEDVSMRTENDEERVLKYAKYFVSKGADVNARYGDSGYTPLGNAKYANNQKGLQRLSNISKALAANNQEPQVERSGTCGLPPSFTSLHLGLFVNDEWTQSKDCGSVRSEHHADS